MVHVDLFSGIGGFVLACEWAGIETILFCEIDDFCQKVLKKHWPDVPIVRDIRNVEEIVAKSKPSSSRTSIGTPCEQEQIELRGRSGKSLLLTAGFPCQPFSQAGRRKGSADDRYLWPETLAVIEAVKPDWILLENVAGILSMVFPDSAVGVASQASLLDSKNEKIADYRTIIGGILDNLKEAGYEVAPPLVIPACAVNAPHRRDRVWIIAHNSNVRCSSKSNQGKGILRSNQTCREVRAGNQSENVVAHNDSTLHKPRKLKICSKGYSVELCNQDVANSNRERLPQREMLGRNLREKCQAAIRDPWQENWYEVAVRFCRMDDGIPRVVDRVERLKALGNAIVPQVAYQIIKAIVEVERMSQMVGE